MELTRNEIAIMEVLWKESRPLTGAEIVKLSEAKTWKDSSIHILLNSLLAKKAIMESGFVRTGKGFGRTFEPTESGEQYYVQFLVDIAEKTSFSKLFSALFKSKEFTKDTLEELEQLLKKKKQELE